MKDDGLYPVTEFCAMGKVHRIIKRARKMQEFRLLAHRLRAAGVDLNEYTLTYHPWPRTNKNKKYRSVGQSQTVKGTDYSVAFILANLQHVGFYRICYLCDRLADEISWSELNETPTTGDSTIQ